MTPNPKPEISQVVPCKKCGAAISSTQTTCPICDTKKPHTKKPKPTATARHRVR